MLRNDWRQSVRLMLAMVCSVTAHAGGPRFVTGTVGYTTPGSMMAFRTSTPLYFTDAGALSASVSHAQADAMVASAAAVWNVSPSSLVLAQGGVLAEHVDGGNTYLGGTGVVFPPDVAATNYLAVPIAILYDTDGSVTDTLLGEGASDPSGCRQTGATESVDGFGPAGTIDHAVIILNGRCIAALPQSLLQMQYQLMRAFGRVLGLAWAQVNDNVFTGLPTPTAVQMAHWPVMHPLDVLCGGYTYQCMVNPFVLRDDDVSSLALLYPVTATNISPGKTLTLQDGVEALGHLFFPTIQGMELANITVRRLLGGHPERETWETASTITGAQFQQNGGNAISGGPPTNANSGSGNLGWEGAFAIARIPVPDEADLFLTVASINPLYVGDAALGPYERPPTAISGSGLTTPGGSFHPGNIYGFDLTMGDAAPVCAPGNDGYEWAPVPADSSGWWSGQLCMVGHASWWNATIKAARSWTMEVTALDDSGAASEQKLQPAIGVWNATDPTGTAPSAGSAATAMNAIAPGMTRLLVPAMGNDRTVRIVVADQFGAGRPDFNYRARLLYADSVTPGTVASNGGLIRIAGSGFRQGNRVLVNGVNAAISSWSATQIVATAPAFSAGGRPSDSVDVTVLDTSTGGLTTISGALVYSAPTANTIQVVSAPASLETGFTAATPFAVMVLAPDGVTPVAGAAVQFAVASGGAVLGCGQSCLLQTDLAGMAQTTVSGATAGSVTLSATEVMGGAAVQVTIKNVDPVRSVTLATTSQYVAAGATASWNLSLTAMQDGAAAASVPVLWKGPPGMMVQTAAGMTDAAGTAGATVQASAVAAGSTSVLTGCAWSNVCATWTLYGVDASLWRVTIASGMGQSVRVETALSPIVFRITDPQGHPLEGASAMVYQTVTAWEGDRSGADRCPSAPVLTTLKNAFATDVEGSFSITPLQMTGVPQLVNVAVAAGSQGFVSTSLTIAP